MTATRRRFLHRSLHAAMGGVGLFGSLGTLQLVEAATRAAGGVPSDYKAMVCVFLFGGNDSFNMVVPCDNSHYGIYNATRPALAIPQAALLPLTPQPGGLPSDGGSYGLHPAMPELRDLFNAQQASILANVGTLIGPITQSEYQNHSRPVPPQLFSHDDQSHFWQTSRPDDISAAGWGGRIADLLHAANPGQDLPMTLSLAGQSVQQRGDVIDQYVMNPCSSDGSSCGVAGIDYLDVYQNELGAQSFQALMAPATQTHLFERAYADATRRSIATYTTLQGMLQTLPIWSVPFPNSSLGAQLRQVANLINVRGPGALDMRRQIFFVAQGGHDTHDNQLGTQAALLADLSASLHAFYQATVQMGIATDVTTFTASDFGRSLSTNGDGTDHGWGGHHFVMGGGVRGGHFFGQMPSLLQYGNPDDAGYGQIIPTTGVDQYAATLARWFGVDAAGLDTIFPSLALYPTQDLGFFVP